MKEFTGQMPACKIYIYTYKIIYIYIHTHWSSTFCSTIRQKIERSHLTGSNRELIVSTAIYPFAMTMFDQFIYWTDWNTRSIYRANKHDGSGQTVMIQNLPSRPMDIHVLASMKQQQCDSPCQQFNGGCSHICTPGTSRGGQIF